MTSVGFPHSDIFGSTPACDSPKLFAANHVLHRLLTPRHPSCALSSLTTNLLWTASSSRRTWARLVPRKLVGDKSHHLLRDTPSTRSRSKLHEGALTRRIPSTLVSLKDTLSRRRLVFNFQRTGSAKSLPTSGERSRTLSVRKLSSKVAVVSGA
jgi:hypothetical protein